MCGELTLKFKTSNNKGLLCLYSFSFLLYTPRESLGGYMLYAPCKIQGGADLPPFICII